jgi:hypothetical protein
MRVLMLDFGILRLMSFLMECLCMAPLTPAMHGDEGVYFPSVVLHGINWWVIFGVFMLGAWYRNLSRQYVDSMNWTVYMGEENIGVCLWFGALTMHRMYCLSFSWHALAWGESSSAF